MSRAKFKWIVGENPPPLQSHSAAKLKIVRDYLERYLETVTPDPRADKLSLSLIDGFSGGGAFTADGIKVPGSPIIMMDAVDRAERRINQTRKKEFRIEATYYFVDTSKSALEFLRKEVEERGKAS